MGNVYMEADQVRFKNSTYHNLQTAVTAALEGGGGGGTTVVANPEGSATADLAKLQVGTTIYGIPAEAGDISYDNTSSGMTADDVQEAIDELNTGIGGISELIPSDATSSNKLATADDIPGVATTLAPGIVQPDGTTITIVDGVISAVGGSGSGVQYSTSEFDTGKKWIDGRTIYGRVLYYSALGNKASVTTNLGSNLIVLTLSGYCVSKTDRIYYMPVNYPAGDSALGSDMMQCGYNASTGNVYITSYTNREDYEAYVIAEYVKIPTP